jgi:2-polyprenyl-6-methoxyphenol hydroxylase-like FAD-dependent oxidoreductase
VHVVIMGCGPVGSELAARLQGAGHAVAVIDKNPNAFPSLQYGLKTSMSRASASMGGATIPMVHILSSIDVREDFEPRI